MQSSIKYKFLSFDELVINMDRLSRFKSPDESFSRVFNSIIYRNLISPKYSKVDIERLDSRIIVSIVEEIWNASVDNIFDIKGIANQSVNKALNVSVEATFKNIEQRTKSFLNAIF